VQLVHDASQFPHPLFDHARCGSCKCAFPRPASHLLLRAAKRQSAARMVILGRRAVGEKRKKLAHDLQMSSNARSHGIPTGASTIEARDIYERRLRHLRTPVLLFTDSAENAAERPVQNSNQRAKCALLTALHNYVGALN
jgi:hypothetical protein